MPPRVPRQVAQSLYECPSCSFKRTFASSSARWQIGPESPKYIEVPEPPQQTTPDRTRLKGILPVPRDIFGGAARGRGIDKADPENIAKSTKQPSKQRRVKAFSDDSRLAWKERMADMRRSHLKEGLEALRERRVRTDRYLSARGKQRQEEREARLHRPEREDERLTDPTVAPELLKILEGGLEDPNRAVRLAMKKDRVERREAARKEDREEDLHSLYMQARTFITTEDQLTKAIDAAFGTPEYPTMFGVNNSDPQSVWAQGKPATVQDMLHIANKTGNPSLLQESQGYAAITRERVQRMAEALTGGKMDDDDTYGKGSSSYRP